MRFILNKILSAWRLFTQAFKNQAVNTIENESRELEHIFGVLVLGSFIGLPAPPGSVTLELLPLMEDDIVLLLDKMETAQSPFSYLFSVLEVS